MKMNFSRHQVVEQYAKLALKYDSRWSHYVQATTDATRARLQHADGDVLDVGCGTGAMLSRLLIDFPAVNLAGVDASQEMLDVARSRLPSAVRLEQCWAEELPFEDCRFSTVICCNMFHFIRRPELALAEMMRVLRPGGMLVITDWCDDYLTCKLCDLYLRWFDPSHHRIYGRSECRQILQAADAQNIIIERYRITWLWGMMTATAHKSH